MKTAETILVDDALARQIADGVPSTNETIIRQRLEIERLRAALKHARIDLNAARIVVRQTLEKVEAALGDQQGTPPAKEI